MTGMNEPAPAPAPAPPAPAGPRLYDLVGGLPALEAILTEFYRRVFADVMIGHLFSGQDAARLVHLEARFSARVLGAHEVEYPGRPMGAAHARHPIFRGHFHRRNQLLAETLRDLAAPPAVVEAWLGHARSLERAILGARPATRCEPAVPRTGGGLVVVPGRTDGRVVVPARPPAGAPEEP